MRILIYGLGGVGGYIAAHLAKTQHEIVGVARGEHLKAIQENGLHPQGALHVSCDEGDFVSHFEAVDTKELSGVFDIVLFCVKSYDLEHAALTCKPFLTQNSTLLCLSNGVEHGDELRSLLNANVHDGCVYILSHIEKAGHIKKMGTVFNLVFGGKGSEVLAGVLDEAGLRYKVPEDIELAIWKKYIFISTFGVLTSYFDMSIKEVYENHYDEAKELLQEVAAIAKAKNIELEDEIEKSLLTASKLPQSASTSMHKDIKAKKKDELQTLCGYLVREAKRLHLQGTLHVSVPKIEKYYRELLKLHH
jgi:2-dehydropantoate 2-reductase